MKKVFQIKAQGSSMYPILRDGDRIEYSQTSFAKIHLNDIVLIYQNDVLVTHRVIYKTKTTCITRGDNNKSADVTTQKGRVLARVERFKRNGRWYNIQDVYISQSALYLHEIQKFASLLKLHKLPHVFLKGVLISLRYENKIPQRIYADCDVLVPRSSYKKCETAFKILGYIPIALSENDSIPYLKKIDLQPEVSFIKLVGGIYVVFDVHFEPVFLMSRLPALRLLYPQKLLCELGDKIIASAAFTKINGFNYSLCTKPDQILYLALHIFHHNFTDSQRYQLLDAAIRKSAPRKDMWGELANTIKDYKLEGYVYGVFLLLKKYFKTPIPPSFILAIRPKWYMLHVACYIVKHVDIFSQESRIKAGIQRFILIILLSPNPFWIKIFIFFHPEVLYFAIRTITMKLF